MGSISKDTICKARQTDLVSFLLSRGEPLKKKGRRFMHKDHDSLVITGNMFYWNSRQEKGNSLDFVMLYYGWDFLTAINELTGVELPKVEYSPSPVHEELCITKGSNVKRVIAYLCKTRRVRYDVVRYLLENRLISQDKMGNAVFKIYDESLDLVGAEVVGTLSNTRYKHLEEGTKLGYGFNFTVGKPVYTLFFECPLDAISYWCMFYDKITSHRFVSLAGLRMDIFLNIVSVFNISMDSIFLCVDNDKGGKVFADLVIKGGETAGLVLPPNPCVRTCLPSFHKDWNDVLKHSSP